MPSRPRDNSAARLVLALVCLMVGSMTTLLLDGQTFRNNLIGIAPAGASALLASGPARGPGGPGARLLVGRLIVAVDLPLAAALAAQLPSAHRFERDFNRGRERRRRGGGMRRTPYLGEKIQTSKIGNIVNTTRLVPRDFTGGADSPKLHATSPGLPLNDHAAN